MRTRLYCSASAFIALLLLFPAPAESRPEEADPLPSWNEGANKKSILEFIRASSDKNGPGYVPPEQRITTFDQDGTLWVEQPLYTQVMFAFDRVKTMAPQHPEWKDKEPFKAILTGDREAMSKFSLQELELVLAETHSGMTIDQFKELVKEWLAVAKHPKFKRPYTECVYQPMLEVMQLLRKNGFKTYIVTGGGQEFVRVYAEAVYGVPPEQVIGTAAVTKYEMKDGKGVLVKVPKVLLIDDKGGKPEGINLVIGRRPVASFGNSDGDREMLEYAAGVSSLRMLVHHDDEEREFAYGAKSKIGTFSDSLMDEAKQKGWGVISMKKDWKRIFAFEK